MPSTTEIEFTLNGRPTRVSVSPSTSVLTMLRETLDLTGAKLACGEGRSKGGKSTKASFFPSSACKCS